MKIKFLIWGLLLLVFKLEAEVFVSVGAEYATGTDSSFYGAKLYVQESDYPKIALHGGVREYSWLLKGVTYTQGGTDYSVGAGDTLKAQSAFVGFDLNLWAQSAFFLDFSASYISLGDVSFGGAITDASFPTSAYEASIGIGMNYGSWTVRPSFNITQFDADCMVLNKTMIELKSSEWINIELVYWW